MGACLEPIPSDLRYAGGSFHCLQIAIEPSEFAWQFIERLFDFSAREIPPEWRNGKYNEARVEVRAEEFRQQCHIGATVGQVLGPVTVRATVSVRGWRGGPPSRPSHDLSKVIPKSERQRDYRECGICEARGGKD